MSSPGTDTPKVYGWCPGALRPMASGDGLVVRIRAPFGRLSQDQMRGVASLSERFGNGLLDLSARANLQLRGIDASNHAALIDGLRDLGLVDETATSEARRNIIMTPFWQTDDASYRIAHRLSDALAKAEDLVLPGKFGFAIDADSSPVLQQSAADIRIERGAQGLILVADGAENGQPITEENAAEAAVALARWFLEQGGAPNGRGRMHQLIARRTQPETFVANRVQNNIAPLPGTAENGQLVALEFGQIPARTLTDLAEFGAIRLTPWRMFLLESTTEIPALCGLILDAGDPRLHVIACTGAPGCLQAHAQTRALARQLATHVPDGLTLHVSGCAKGCAHPKAADVTLVARSADTFDLITNGSASDQPLTPGLSADALAKTLNSAP